MNSLKTWALVAMTVVGATLTACGGGEACGWSNCAGCCSADGVCEPGVMISACGQQGAMCTGCAGSEVCQAGQCVANTCTPRSCADQGLQCGSVSDGCGATITCGACGAGLNCGGGGVPNICGAGTCTPKSCTQLGKNCGAISDGCSVTLNCGACGAGQSCGGGGVANVCGGGTCTPTTCAAAGAGCGSLPNGCGGTLSCGTCPGNETCGGGGQANQCALVCPVSCPPGYSCDAAGSCAGGSRSGIVLNVLDPVKVTVSGTVTMNGAIPATSNCGTGYQRARVTFTHATDSHYDDSITVADCGASNSAYTWSLQLRPGTYSVSVSGQGYSALPAWDIVVNPTLTIGGTSAGNVLNVLDPVKVAVSGTVTMNGAIPATSNCGTGYQRARVTFTHATDYHYNDSITVADCGASNSAYTWSLALRPGTYAVSVTGQGYSALPAWDIVVNPTLTIGGASAGNVLNVLDPVKVTVSGTVTMNGAIPATSNCGTGYQRARVTFTHATDSHYDDSVTVADCGASNSAYTWSLQLRPGTYSVSVSGQGYSALPAWDIVVNPTLTIGGASAGNVLNVLDPVKVTVSGTVTMNGAIPATSNCGTGYQRARVTFSHTTNSHYDDSVTVADCGASNSAYTWSLQLRPGTYSVSVSGQGYSALPAWDIVVNPTLTIGGTSAGNVLNVLDPVKVAVSGTVTMNGAIPATSNCGTGYQRARVTFTHATDSHYNDSVTVADCGASNSAYTWSLALRPGTYAVSVTGQGYSALPAWDIVVNPTLSISGASAGNVLNVLDPGKVTVSGTVTMNGAIPATSNCGTGYQRARVTFSHTTNSHYDDSVTVADCGASNSAYTWSLPLRPGTYVVSVTGQGYSALPAWDVVVVDRLTVQ